MHEGAGESRIFRLFVGALVVTYDGVQQVCQVVLLTLLALNVIILQMHPLGAQLWRR